MNNKWLQIWNSKKIVSSAYDGNEYERFCELKKANGFDVAVEDEDAYFRAFYNGWLKFFDRMNELTEGKTNSVYEVGCGSGVNLFMLKNRIPGVVLAGCDYSNAMVKSVSAVIGTGEYVCCPADQITTEPRYDVVMAESVFQYFESPEYAENVLRKMIEKSNLLTYLGEIHNKEYETELMEYRRRTIADYEERYKGLSKLFLRKERITEIAEEYGRKILFTEIDNPEYLNGKYEFNCYIYV